MESNISGASSIHVGIPTMSLLPPRNYKFEVFDERYKLKVPVSGTFKDLDPEFFKDDETSFELVRNNGSLINISLLTKVLFAAKMYPDLQENQLFCPIAFNFKDDFLEIIGQVMTILPLDKESMEQS